MLFGWVIKVLVEMACDPEPCYSFVCPFIHGSAGDLICVSPHDGLEECRHELVNIPLSKGAEAKWLAVVAGVEDTKKVS